MQQACRSALLPVVAHVHCLTAEAHMLGGPTCQHGCNDDSLSIHTVLTVYTPLGVKRTKDTGGDSLSNRVFKQWPVCTAVHDACQGMSRCGQIPTI